MRKRIATALAADAVTASAARAREGKIHIGVPVFLSGAAAGPFGLPERNVAELLLASLSDGLVPAPHEAMGINGRLIEATAIDDTSDAVVEHRNLVQRSDAEVVIGCPRVLGR